MQTTSERERGTAGSGGTGVHPAPRAENTTESCLAWFASHGERAALLRNSRWPSRFTLKVAFLDGEPSVQERVREVAREWVAQGLARLSLAFTRPAPDTSIRISFRYRGDWSLIGTTSLREPYDAPTMNFGRLHPGVSERELRRVVLHEFGHALGLIHEHQNPTGGIRWDEEAIYQELMGPPNHWSRELIEKNVFRAYSRDETNFSRFDPDSIMLYPIKRSWTLDGYSVGLNDGLSELDKEFIRQMYP